MCCLQYPTHEGVVEGRDQLSILGQLPAEQPIREDFERLRQVEAVRHRLGADHTASGQRELQAREHTPVVEGVVDRDPFSGREHVPERPERVAPRFEQRGVAAAGAYGDGLGIVVLPFRVHAKDRRTRHACQPARHRNQRVRAMHPPGATISRQSQ